MNRADTLALEVTSPRPGKHRFGNKTILHPQRFFHRGTQIFLNLNRVSHQMNNSPPPGRSQRAGGSSPCCPRYLTQKSQLRQPPIRVHLRPFAVKNSLSPFSPASCKSSSPVPLCGILSRKPGVFLRSGSMRAKPSFSLLLPRCGIKRSRLSVSNSCQLVFIRGFSLFFTQ
jgi:hypothetical protein